MKIDVTTTEAANLYIGKAVALLDLACELFPDHCEGCPMSNGPKQSCQLGILKAKLFGQ